MEIITILISFTALYFSIKAYENTNTIHSFEYAYKLELKRQEYYKKFSELAKRIRILISEVDAKPKIKNKREILNKLLDHYEFFIKEKQKVKEARFPNKIPLKKLGVITEMEKAIFRADDFNYTVDLMNFNLKEKRFDFLLDLISEKIR